MELNNQHIVQREPQREPQPTDQEKEESEEKLTKDRALGVILSQSYDVMEINVSGEVFALPR